MDSLLRVNVFVILKSKKGVECCLDPNFVSLHTISSSLGLSEVIYFFLLVTEKSCFSHIRKTGFCTTVPVPASAILRAVTVSKTLCFHYE